MGIRELRNKHDVFGCYYNTAYYSTKYAGDILPENFRVSFKNFLKVELPSGIFFSMISPLCNTLTGALEFRSQLGHTHRQCHPPVSHHYNFVS